MNAFLKSLKSSKSSTSQPASAPIGAQFSHLNKATAAGKKKKKNRAPTTIYTDSDEDWEEVPEAYPPPLPHKSKLAQKINPNPPHPLLRPGYELLLVDPLAITLLILGPDTRKFDENLIGTLGAREELNAAISRYRKFETTLDQPTVDLEALKKLAWNGVPSELRLAVWQLLSGHLSASAARRVSLLQQKRQEYSEHIAKVMGGTRDQVTWHQICIDMPRTNPHIPLYSTPTVQRALERVLYLWAVRHPASGYVQGINDICTPFFQVFLSSYLRVDKANSCDIDNINPEGLPQEIFDAVEADTYFCLTRLLDSIQDNYIHAQPGIIRQVGELRDLTSRIDGELVRHLEDQNIEFLQFSFRWMNCMLMRELNMQQIIRMWDTYLLEGTGGFLEFHIYVCAAFLVKWSEKLKSMDFQEIMIFLQSLPTKNWGDKEVEMLLSEAYMWQSLYKNASAHLR